MKVITLDKNSFIDKCRELRIKFENEFGHPSLTVGIASGGEFVARQFADPFENLTVVTRRRKTSEAKTALTERIIKKLPVKANDLLRMGESKLAHLKWIVSGKKPLAAEPFHLPQHVIEKLMEVPEDGVVALVDDAADSGETLFIIRNAIGQIRPDLRIVTAVITMTRSQAAPVVDVALFRNETLIRFPWAMDYK